MTNTLLDQALNAARKLPQQTQDAIAADIIERVGDYDSAKLTPEQEAEVERRLSQPAHYASDARVTAFFARFGIQS